MDLGKLGFGLMALGFLYGAFVLVQHPAMVEWVPYGIAVVVTSVGAGMIRRAKGQAGSEASKVSADIATIERSLEELVEKVRQMNADKQSADTFSFCGRIDDECMDPINSFVDAREALIHRYGLERYAAVMDNFALGERALNRTWCASADGYVDEVDLCLSRALSYWEKALEAVKQASDSPP
jgi:hypothetical protein